MKKILLSFVLCCVLFCGCEKANRDPNTTDNYHEMSAQRFFDNYVKADSITYNGHDYIFYETGIRGYRNYSFTMEHRTDCKECLAIFD